MKYLLTFLTLATLSTVYASPGAGGGDGGTGVSGGDRDARALHLQKLRDEFGSGLPNPKPPSKILMNGATTRPTFTTRTPSGEFANA